jgi:hypothetical protein
MNWKAKRAIGTIALTSAPYFAWTFVTLDPTAAFSSELARLNWLLFTSFIGGMTYTYPGWRY